VDQTVRLPITPQPGVVAQSVDITAAAPLLDSATSSLGQLIDNKKPSNPTASLTSKARIWFRLNRSPTCTLTIDTPLAGSLL
jgi:hypothetical protein